jgi:hypothetical protein
MCRKSNFNKVLICLPAVFLLAVTAVSAQRIAEFEIGQTSFVPKPRLIAPATDVVDLTGKEELEFKWSPHEGDQVRRDHYDFRLYRGYNMVESTRILKMNIPPRQWSITLKAGLFENGQVYTWSLRQVYTGSAKSWRSFESFKVIKR